MEKCWCEDYEWNENGECWDRYRTIIDHSYGFGIRSEIVGRLLLVAPNRDDYIHEEDDPRKFQLNMEVSTGSMLEDVVLDEYVSINYCPFCGRKLEVPRPGLDRIAALTVDDVIKEASISGQTASNSGSGGDSITIRDTNADS